MFGRFFAVILLFNCVLRSSVTDAYVSPDIKIKLDKSAPGLDNDERGVLNTSDDAFLTTPQLIKKYGYPVEIRTVVTVDGYILEIHRIPKPGGIPVLLIHGITDSSAGWVIMGTNNGLGYILANSGYDVWLGNVRGTRYSQKHIHLSTSNKRFWDFSFHEMGVYDLPAMMDYIIAETGFEKIHYIGFSQGTTCFWVMCSELPTYCDKIIVMNALAPVAFLVNSKSPVIKFLSTFINQFEKFSALAGESEFLPSSALLALSGQLICRDRAITQALCSNVIFLIVGYDSEQLNATTLPVIFGHIPAGAASKQFVHYGQFVRSGFFRQYDYGLFRNIIKYGTLLPPLYNLSGISAPVALHYAANDWLSSPTDVSRLANGLPNVIERHLVAHPHFTHGDFLYAIDVKTLVYDHVLEIMRSAETKLKIHTTIK